MVEFYQKQPQSNPFLPFILLHPDYKVLKKLALSVVPEEHAVFSSANDFDAQRRQAVDKMLAIFSCCFLVGASGVGKTTFVKKNFSGEDLFVGLSELEKWAKQGGIFYLDEINLYPRGTLDFFAGLFNSNPGLLLNNQFYPIKLGHKNGLGSKKHQLKVGGNYNDYANRQSHDFLQQVPVIEFMDFPDWYLKERVLKKAIRVSGLFEERKLDEIMDILLKVYRYVNEQNPGSQWTIRDLENMALRFMLFREERPNESADTASWLAAYDEVSNHNKAEWISFFQGWIEAQFSLKETIANLNKKIMHKTDSFILTECRQNLFRLMQDQVKIQIFKSKYPELSDFGAVCGFFLVGEAAVGKTKTATELAISLGYKNGDDPAQRKGTDTKYYYIISPKTDESLTRKTLTKESESELSLSPIEQKLTNLFHEGALVIFDEINSFNLEKIFNALMSGHDLSMNKAKNSGFIVFASGNPIHYTGRKKLGIPLENRMFRVDVLDYSQKGLFQIAKHQGLHPFFAKASAAYFQQSILKNKENCSAPNFRAYLDKIASIKEDNPLSTWFFLEKIYGYLAERDRQSLYCTSLFTLSAFAFLHQPALFESPIEEAKDKVPFEKESLTEDAKNEFEKNPEENEPNNVDNNFLYANQKIQEQDESAEQNCCFSAISMQILGGVIAVLGIAAVALAFTVLNAATLGLAGIITLALGGAAILTGVGFFAKGTVDNCSSPEPHSLSYCTIY